MKQKLKIACALLAVVICAIACSPEPQNEQFIGTYSGKVGYNKGIQKLQAGNGSVTVTRRGDNFYFAFSENIPALNGIPMVEKGNGNFVLKDAETSSNTVSISSTGSLEIFYKLNNETWLAHCSRK